MTFAPQARVNGVTIEQAVSVHRPQGNNPSPLSSRKPSHEASKWKSSEDRLLYQSATPSPRVVSPWPRGLDKRLCKRVLAHPRCPSVLSASPAGAGSVRSGKGSPKKSADHYAYLLMQLCQQLKERRSRQIQSAFSLEAATASARASAPAAENTEQLPAAASCSRCAGRLCCSCCSLPTCTATAVAKCNPSSCARCCRRLSARAAADETNNETRGSFIEACSGCFASPSITCNSARGNENVSVGLPWQDEPATEPAAAGWRLITAATGGERDDFVLCNSKHQQHVDSQHQWQVQQKEEPERLLLAGPCIHGSPSRLHGDGDPVPGLKNENQKPHSSCKEISINSPSCCRRCICSSPCNRPCQRVPEIKASEYAIIHTCNNVLNDSLETTYEDEPSTAARRRWQTHSCGSEVADTRVVTCANVSLPRLDSGRPRANNSCSNPADVRRSAQYASVALPQSFSSRSCRTEDLYEAGSAVFPAENENELEPYLCSTADDMVGRSCERHYMWKAAASAILKLKQQETYVPAVSMLQQSKAIATAETHKADAAPRLRHQTGVKSSRVERKRATAATAVMREGSDAATAAPNDTEANRKGGSGTVCKSYTQYKKTPLEGACLEELQRKISTEQYQREAIIESSSRYDNELELYEHQEADICIDKYTFEMPDVLHITAAAPAAGPHVATSFDASPSLVVHREGRQQKSRSEVDTDPQVAPPAVPLTSRLSSYMEGTWLAATSEKEETGKGAPRAASRSSSSSSSVSFGPSLQPVPKAAEPSTAAADSQYTQLLSKNELELYEYSNNDAGAPSPEHAENAATYSFFSCLSPHHRQLSFTNSQKCALNNPALQPAAAPSAYNSSSCCFSTFSSDAGPAAATIAAAGPAPRCPLSAERTLLDAAAPPTASPISTGPAAATGADIILQGGELLTRAVIAAETCVPGRLDSEKKAAYDNELEIYVYKASYTATEDGTAQYLKTEIEDVSSDANSRRMRWAGTAPLRDDATAAAHTMVNVSSKTSNVCYEAYYSTQCACASLPQQRKTAASRHGSAAVPQQKWLAEAPVEEGGERSVGSSCCCCRSSRAGSADDCDPQAVKHWLMQQKKWGACEACTDYAEEAAASPRGRRLGRIEDRGADNCVTCLQKHCGTAGELTAASPSLSARQATAVGEKGALEELQQQQQQGRHKQQHWKQRSTVSMPRQCPGKGAISSCYEQQRRVLDSHPQQQKQQLRAEPQLLPRQRTPRSASYEREPQQKRKIVQPRAPPSPQREFQLIGQRQQQQQRLPQQQQQQQQLQRRQQRGNPASSATFRRQQLEEILPTGRRDWHVAAYEDVVELKKKKQGVRNSRSLSCGSRTAEKAVTDIRMAAASVQSGEHRQSGRETQGKTATTAAVSGKARPPASGCFSASKGCWPLDLPQSTPGSDASDSECKQKHRGELHDQGAPQQRRQSSQDEQDVLPFQQRENREKSLPRTQDGQKSACREALLHQGRCVAAHERRPVVHQEGDNTQMQNNTGCQQYKEKHEKPHPSEGFGALYPMHAHHHIKQSKYAEGWSESGESQLSQKDMASRPTWRGGERGDGCVPGRRSAPQGEGREDYVSHTSLQRKDEEKNPFESNQIDSCCLREEEAASNPGGFCYVKTVDTSTYAQRVAHSRSPAVSTSFALSPSCPSENEPYLPLHRQQQVSTSPPHVLQKQQSQQQHYEFVQETQIRVSDSRFIPGWSTQIGGCRPQPQQRQQLPVARLQQVCSQKQNLKQNAEQKELSQQRQHGEEAEQKTNQTGQQTGQERERSTEIHKRSQKRDEAPNCTCPVTPRNAEKAEGVIRRCCFP